MQEGTKRLAGISRAVVLHVCAEQAHQVQAFKLARWAHMQLQTLRLSPSRQVTCHTAWSHTQDGLLHVQAGAVMQLTGMHAPHRELPAGGRLLPISSTGDSLHDVKLIGLACTLLYAAATWEMVGTTTTYQGVLCRIQWTSPACS